MTSTKHLQRPLRFRTLASFLILSMSLLGCPPMSATLPPTAGTLDHQRDAQIPFRYGHVNAIGGNLYVERVDLSIDTRLGTLDIGAVYNSRERAWRWSFESRYGTVFFTDPTGAVHDTSGLGDGEAIPGTTWIRLDDHRLQTKSGRVYTFDLTRRLRSIHWGGATYPLQPEPD